MNLKELKEWTSLLVMMAIGLYIIIGAAGGDEFFLQLVGSIGGLALLTWIAAVVADATVHSLKKEN